MFRSLDVAATGMASQETKLDTIANNIANANTVGFKRQSAEFQDLLYQTMRAPAPTPGGTGVMPEGINLGSGSRIASTSRSFADGAVIQTDNPYDVAIKGSGFLGVTLEDGTRAYTRAGNLKVDRDLRLTTVDGLTVEPPISIPAEANPSEITINPDGSVYHVRPGTEPLELGRLQLTTFANPSGLEPMGKNLYRESAASGEANTGDAMQDGRGQFVQNYQEASNVESVKEMIELVRTQRAYEINSRVISTADQMLQRATQLR